MDDSYEIDNSKRALIQRCKEVIGQVESCVSANPQDIEDLLLDLTEHLEK